MLQTQQQKNRYNQPFFKSIGASSDITQQALERAIENLATRVYIRQSVVGLGWDKYSIGYTDLETFMAIYSGLRDELLFRQVKGDPLGKTEEIALHFLNRNFERLLPSSKPEGYEQVLNASKKADQILDLFSRGNNISK